MIANEDPVIANSLWSATANTSPDCPALQEDVACDVVIIGAGFTGLSAALHLAEMGKSVVVVEAQTPGWGASGRNGGQVNPGLIDNPSAAIRDYGDAVGRKMIAMSGASGKLVFDLIAKHNIQCDARPVGWIRAAHNASSLQEQITRAKDWQSFGAEVAVLSKAQVTDMIGTDAYVGGTIDYRGGNIHPLNYALGLADAALKVGVKIYGQSPAQKLTSQGENHIIKTPQGAVTAGKVLVCTNGYTGDLIPGLKQTLIPVRSVQVATKPLSDNVLKSILPGKQAPSDTRNLLLYYRTDAQGRFIMGGRGSYGAATTQKRQADARKITAKLFPQLGDVEWDYAWGGFIAITTDHYPHLTTHGPGIAAGMGYNGRGVAMGTAMGKVLADWAAGVPADDLDFPVTKPAPIPFHRFHKLGVGAASVKYQIMDKLGI